jgi:hypothetical protein
MSDNNLYQQYTLNQLLTQINGLKIFLDFYEKYYLKTVTKKQKEILDIFDIKIPNVHSINYFIKVTLKD